MIPHIYNGNGTISLMLDGVMKPVDTAHRFYEEIKAALKAQDWDAIPSLVNIKQVVESAIASGSANGKVTVRDGEVFYGATRIHNSLANRIVSMAKEGFDIGHMVKFLENLMANPSYRAVNELYDFLEAGGIPITENGTFLTYKKIRADYTDIHSGKFLNNVGAVVDMPRNMVNEDSSQTCSAGLHVCSYNYLPHFGCGSGERVVICEVNPADVVSIPADYNNTKMRVCRYTVIGEVTNYTDADILRNAGVMNTSSVYRGSVAGTVSHSIGKPHGKDATLALEAEEISGDTLGLVCEKAGLEMFSREEVAEIANDGDYKRAGKKVARYIDDGAMDATKFAAALKVAIEAGENDTCARCGADLDGEDECPSCGYWN